jgi:hypothetical protein
MTSQTEVVNMFNNFPFVEKNLVHGFNTNIHGGY